MSKNRDNTPKSRKFRRPLRGEGSVVSEWWSRLVSRVAGVKDMVEADGELAEPIDFSSPSVPYYAELARKFNLARIVLYMVLFAFLVVTLFSSRQLITYENVYYLFKDINAANMTAQSQADRLNYSVSDEAAAFAPFRGGVVVVGGDEITVLSGSGKQTLSANVKYSFPCVSAGDQSFVAFSRGEKNFSIYNAFVRVHHGLTEYPVYDACMGKDGCVAVLTRSMDYTSEVIWYNDKMSKLAACHLGGYVTAMTVSQDSRTLAVLSMEVKNGAYESKLILLRRGSGGAVTAEEVAISGAPLGAEFTTEDRLCVVYGDRLCVYRLDGELASEKSFDGAQPLLWNFTAGYCAVLCQSTDTLSQKTLQVYDKNGGSVYTAEISPTEKYSSLVMDGQTVYLLGVGHILRVGSRGDSLKTAAVERDTVALLVDSGGRLMAMTPAYARYMESRDFS